MATKPLRTPEKKKESAVRGAATIPSAHASRLRWQWHRSSNIRELLPDRIRLQEILQEMWAERGQPAALIEINFVTEKAIRRLHQEFLDDPAATDIITFDLGPAPDRTRVAALFICLPMARKSAARYRVALESEISRLLIHGCLHLMGYDDHTPAQRRRMRRQENQILKRLSHPPASA